MYVCMYVCMFCPWVCVLVMVSAHVYWCADHRKNNHITRREGQLKLALALTTAVPSTFSGSTVTRDTTTQRPPTNIPSTSGAMRNTRQHFPPQKVLSVTTQESDCSSDLFIRSLWKERNILAALEARDIPLSNGKVDFNVKCVSSDSVVACSELTSDDAHDGAWLEYGISPHGKPFDGLDNAMTTCKKMKRRGNKRKRKKRKDASVYSLNHVTNRGLGSLPAVRLAPLSVRMGTEDKIYEYNVMY